VTGFDVVLFKEKIKNVKTWFKDME